MSAIDELDQKSAATSVPLHPLIAGRWSPRAFDRSYELGDDELQAMLEAARWAASSGNSQPWRFYVAKQDDEAYPAIFSALAPGNQSWAGYASALVVVAARTTREDGTPEPYALYDTGQAVANMALQASSSGLSVHQMGGFDRELVRSALALGASLTPAVVLAVGRKDESLRLPGPLDEIERASRTRSPLASLMLPGPVSAIEAMEAAA
jgi:nitroreductase